MNRFWALLIVSLAFLLYSNTLKGKFVFDDIPVIRDNEVIRILDVGRIFRYQPSRFIPNLSFALNYAGSGNDPFSYHIVNIILHILTAFVVYWLTKLIIRNNFFIPAFTSFLFLTHPIETQAVSYLTQRTAELSALLYLISLAFFIKYIDSKSVLFYLLSLISAVCAFYSKENSFTLPVVVLLVSLFFLTKRMKIGYLLLLEVPFIAAAVFVFLTFRFNVPLTLTKQTVTDISHQIPGKNVYYLTQINVAATYLRLMVYPVNQNLDYDYPLTRQFDSRTVLSLAVILFLYAIGIFLFRKNRIVLFGLLFFYVTISVESYFVLEDVIMEHRLYLPSFGIFLIISFLFEWVYRKTNKYHFPVAYLLPAAVILLLSFMTFSRNKVWQDEYSLWSDVVSKSPDKARGHSNLGLVFQLRRNNIRAQAEYEKALSIDPKHIKSLLNLANIHKSQKELDKAEGDYKKILSIDRSNAPALSGLGAMYLKNKSYKNAESLYSEALILDPANTPLYIGLGDIFAAENDLEEAKVYMKKAIEISPDLIDAYFSLAQIYLREKNYPEAKSNLEKIISLDPYHRNALINLGIIYLNEKNYQKSIDILEKFRKSDKSDYEGNYYLGLAYYLNGEKDPARNYLEQALSARPGDADAKKLLDSLKSI